MELYSTDIEALVAQAHYEVLFVDSGDLKVAVYSFRHNSPGVVMGSLETWRYAFE
jgi:hypothetical protein